MSDYFPRCFLLTSVQDCPWPFVLIFLMGTYMIMVHTHSNANNKCQSSSSTAFSSSPIITCYVSTKDAFLKSSCWTAFWTTCTIQISCLCTRILFFLKDCVLSFVAIPLQASAQLKLFHLLLKASFMHRVEATNLYP